MKFVSSTISAVFLAVASLDATSANVQECVTTVDPNKDYFPDKVTPLESEGWDIEYFKTYKVLTNKANNETFALYQCGTTPPTGNFNSIIPVPIKKLVIASTTQIPFLEVFGEREAIKGGFGTFWTAASGCFKQGVDDGTIPIGLSSANETLLGEVDINVNDTVALMSFGASPGVFPHYIHTQVASEPTSEAASEWRKYFGAFFNKEKEANMMFQQTIDLHECVEKNAELLADDEIPTMVWASYSNYSKGWDVARDGNYYSELARICSADLLSTADGGGSIPGFLRTFMTPDEFGKFAENATVWIYPSGNIDAFRDDPAVFPESVKNIKAFKDKQVYDYLGTKDGWFNERQLEADVLLEDFCALAGTLAPTNPPYVRKWFRNVFTEATGLLPVCIDYSAPLVVRSSACVPFVASTAPSGAPTAIPTAMPTALPTAEPNTTAPTSAPTSAATGIQTGASAVVAMVASLVMAFSV